MTTEEIELRASEIILQIEKIGLYGVGQIAGVLVERRPHLASHLAIAINLAKEELKDDTQRSKRSKRGI